jgi:hypothetical protein
VKAYRTEHPEPTDCKLPKDYIRDWKRQRGVWLDATVNGTMRRTRFGLRLADSDVVALFYALVESLGNQEALRLCPEAISRLAVRLQQAANANNDALNKDVGEAELSVRVEEKLRGLNIHTVRELARMSAGELKGWGFSSKDIDQVHGELARLGLSPAGSGASS